MNDLPRTLIAYTPCGYVSVPVSENEKKCLGASILPIDNRITSAYIQDMHLISRIRWTDAAIAHVARHGVHPEEVEAVCFSEDPIIRSGREGLHYIFGQTDGGRYLFIVVREARPGEVRIVTAREMDAKERAYYRRRGK